MICLCAQRLVNTDHKAHNKIASNSIDFCVKMHYFQIFSGAAPDPAGGLTAPPRPQLDFRSANPPKPWPKYATGSSVLTRDIWAPRACAVLDCWRQGIGRLLDACFRIFAQCAKKKIFNSFTSFSRWKWFISFHSFSRLMPPKQCVGLVLWIASKTSRAASVFGQSRNRCVGKFRTAAVRPFLVRFTKTKHARFDQDKIFPTI